MSIERQHLRMAEALLFAAKEPLDKATLERRLPDDVDIDAVMGALAGEFEGHGIELVARAGRWSFQTAADLGFLMSEERQVARRLSRAATETLAIIAYHQPMTRAEIEEVRGVSLSKGTLDVLFEAGWIRPRGRRRTPGRPVTYGTTDDFLIHFGLESVQDLPGLDELRATGLLSVTPPASVPRPVSEDEDDAEAEAEEDPWDDEIDGGLEDVAADGGNRTDGSG
jgi:segregation and condensation protein B